MSKEKNKYDFESGIAKNFFGNGINVKRATRDEMKRFLNELPDLLSLQGWLRMVGFNFVENTDAWGEESLLRYLGEVKRDCKKILRELELRNDNTL